jgi:hypothetical protein
MSRAALLPRTAAGARGGTDRARTHLLALAAAEGRDLRPEEAQRGHALCDEADDLTDG